MTARLRNRLARLEAARPGAAGRWWEKPLPPDPEGDAHHIAVQDAIEARLRGEPGVLPELPPWARPLLSDLPPGELLTWVGDVIKHDPKDYPSAHASASALIPPSRRHRLAIDPTTMQLVEIDQGAAP